MEEFEALSNDYEKKQCIGGIISEQILIIGGALSPIQALKKLAPNPSVLDKSTFANKLSYDELVEVTVNLDNSLIACRKVLKGVRTNLEDHDPIYPTSDSSPQLVSDICELKTKFDSFVSTQPAPVDYANAVVAKLPKTVSTPVSQVNIRKEVKQATDEQMRSNNLIIYHVPYDKDDPIRASDCAAEYFTSCGIAQFHLECDKIVDAQYLNISPDQTSCNIKVFMTNSLVVRSLLSVTRQLKTTDRDMFRGKQFDFNKTYVHKDRTFLEQTQHKQLVLELKKKISEDPSTKWIIKFGRVEAGGTFNRT